MANLNCISMQYMQSTKLTETDMTWLPWLKYHIYVITDYIPEHYENHNELEIDVILHHTATNRFKNKIIMVD